MSHFSAVTFFLQWAAGGWFFLWVTTRRREVGLGYGWIQRALFSAMAIGALAGAAVSRVDPAREAAAVTFVVLGAAAQVSAVRRRRAGVAGQRATVERRSARVAAMTGIDRAAPAFDAGAPEFDPRLDLAAAVAGLVAVVGGAVDAGGPTGLTVARAVVGALFVGAVTDAMLLGHWYLVQPGLARGALLDLVRATGVMWVPELVVWLWPTGMGSVLSGTIDDGYNGLLGWFWAACVVTTIGLVVVARQALREREYSAVMAATGLMYLAILTAFGIDLVARILLAA
ncbi:MAG: hypothetical protein D6683_01190 [Actinomyces sp.]|nr:MAG: hypothetical protein D6683_01190 [Actinomyces sp.]